MKRYIWIYLFVAFFFLSLAFANAKDIKNKDIRTSPFLPEVDVYRVPPPKDVPINLIYPARVKSIKSVMIVSRVSGFLEKRFFTEGSYVRKGEVLFKIEPDIYKARVEKARADVINALALFKKARGNWLRAKNSFKDHVISVEKRDEAKYAYEMAKANLLAKRALLKEAEISLNYTNVRATISGFTGIKKVDVGAFLDVGTPLVQITQINPIYVEFSIPETDVNKYGFIKNRARYLRSLKAKLIIAGTPYPLIGKINFIDTSINKDTDSLKIRAIFPNPNYTLIPYEFVRIKLIGIYKKHLLLIPQRALIQNSYGTMVFVIKDGKAYARIIKIGGSVGNFYIVKAGLKSGDLIALDNFFKLRNAMPVKIDKTLGD